MTNWHVFLLIIKTTHWLLCSRWLPAIITAISFFVKTSDEATQEEEEKEEEFYNGEEYSYEYEVGRCCSK